MVNPRPASFADVTVSPLLSAFDRPSDVTPADGVTNSPSLYLDQSEFPPPEDTMPPPIPPPEDPEDIDRFTPETFIAETHYCPAPPGNRIRAKELRDVVLPLATTTVESP